MKLEFHYLGGGLDLGFADEAHAQQYFSHRAVQFTPIEMARELGVTNRTVINWSASLAKVGLLEPRLIKQRIRSYRVVR